MSVIEITQENLTETIDNNDIVLIDFWAPWCGPCQTFKPIFHDAAEKHPEAVYASCNTEEQQELAAMFGIRSIPTVMVFREKVGVFSQPGMLPAEALEDVLGQVKGLDMEEVHAQVTQQKAKETQA
ncbi:MAG: thiol reductase thioredoxin [Acidobacteria bacterium]|nr:MAG: thiol reductase thioredoxin [Acidobacteriota bacterium]